MYKHYIDFLLYMRLLINVLVCVLIVIKKFYNFPYTYNILE